MPNNAATEAARLSSAPMIHWIDIGGPFGTAEAYELFRCSRSAWTCLWRPSRVLAVKFGQACVLTRHLFPRTVANAIESGQRFIV